MQLKKLKNNETAFSSLVSKHDVPFDLKEVGRGDSNIGKKENHVDGSADVELDFVLSPIPVSEGDDAGPDGIWRTPSMLLMHFVENGTKKYSSEAEISSMVNYALADAQRIVTALTGV